MCIWVFAFALKPRTLPHVVFVCVCIYIYICVFFSAYTNYVYTHVYATVFICIHQPSCWEALSPLEGILLRLPLSAH